MTFSLLDEIFVVPILNGTGAFENSTEHKEQMCKPHSDIVDSDVLHGSNSYKVFPFRIVIFSGNGI